MAKRPHKRHILVLGEEPSVSSRLADLLGELGHEATVYRSRVDVMGAVTAHAPSLVIICSDGQDEQTLSFGATLSSMFEVPFVLIATDWDERRAHAASESGALAYLASRYTNLHLCVAMIVTLLDRHIELVDLRRRSKQIAEALRHARNISAAAGVLMERLHQNRHDAFETLRRGARARRMRLVDSATGLLTALEAINELAADPADRVADPDCDRVHGSASKSR